MARKTLSDILGQRQNDSGTFRWQAVVPIGTNIFMLVELFQFAFVGAAIILLSLCSGVWFTEGSVTMAEIRAAFSVSGMALAAVMVGFIAMALLFFGNRYYAVYRIDASGVYYEGSRGRDERKGWLCLRAKAFPVVGAVRARRTRSRHLLWEKMDSFQDIASMRVIILRRGRWQLLRLYTPDAATHVRVVEVLSKKLRKV